MKEDIKKLARLYAIRKHYPDVGPVVATAYEDGYKAAEAKLYTQEDLKEAYRLGTNDGAQYNQYINDEDWESVDKDDYNERVKKMLSKFKR